MIPAPRDVQTIEAVGGGILPFADIAAANEPVLLKGAVRDWPIVALGREGPRAAIAYLAGFDAGLPVVVYSGPPEIGGRFFYDDRMGMNFTARKGGLTEVLARISAHLGDPAAPALYVGSTDLDTFLPGFRAANDLPLGPPVTTHQDVLASIWIGNRTTAATHYDMSNNIACCLVGHRRFTLFPPDQIANLYPGPLEPTPGGQVVSMVDPRAPDLERYPRFREAAAYARVAEMEPGDVLLYPALWWHNVEALDAFNVMVNYWWNAVASHADTPMTTLLHAMLSLRDRPLAEKQAWRAVFDHYVFGDADVPRAHLPEAAQGLLGPLGPLDARRLRAMLLQKMNR
ncbi:cupin-like domain-containing protein [Sphingomonas sp. AP4-R1]|uniref:cupin-like domain-containing protein n=1 Tax=Sphingomonas sp. AP4-R1 TaxID=2735134 RepID=UPI001493DA7A|nr:cupin-like domain-containing protein [Sphingomonas sp. AP4-R1]QJU59121.1 cupin-like domain-containing protein [Sphingomonas sp. AP4-R1]